MSFHQWSAAQQHTDLMSTPECEEVVTGMILLLCMMKVRCTLSLYVCCESATRATGQISLDFPVLAELCVKGWRQTNTEYNLELVEVPVEGQGSFCIHLLLWFRMRLMNPSQTARTLEWRPFGFVGKYHTSYNQKNGWLQLYRSFRMILPSVCGKFIKRITRGHALNVCEHGLPILVLSQGFREREMWQTLTFDVGKLNPKRAEFAWHKVATCFSFCNSWTQYSKRIYRTNGNCVRIRAQFVPW